MGRLAVRRVEYVGEKYEFSSPPLPDGLVLVEGDNGSGKSTFADLIFFALGGNVKQFSKKGNEQHKEIRSDTNNFVRISIEIDGATYALTRRFDTPSDVLVSSLAAESNPGDVEVLPVHRHAGRRVLSDWILDKLGIAPVTLFTGSYHGKLNFTDLMRLIYHDQELDPARVFMKLDRESFVTDSRDFRRAVFEILVGTSSARYYDMLEKLRLAERVLSDRQAALNAYKGAVVQVAPGRTDSNEVFLREQIGEREGQLERLQRTRITVRKTAPNSPAPESELTVLRQQLATAEVEKSSLDRSRGDVHAERMRLLSLEEQLIDEVVRVQKIIHAHETLSLFSPDTCPCCLRGVDRARDHCICGQPVAEDAYQRFFYDSDEYITILKSKQKNVETVREAKTACDEELAAVSTRVGELVATAVEIRKRMDRWAGTAGAYGTKLEKLDDEIVEVRVTIEKLKQQLDMELERNNHETAVAAARFEVKRLTAEVQRLELEAENDRTLKIARFDHIYTRLMRETLENVRTARLGPDYEPIIDDGDYREKSATVTRRLMYFLTLLQLSLEEDIPFPGFLLVDTPETAGIDRANISRAIGQIPAVVGAGSAQVVLTTGPDRYPAELQKYRVVTLTKTDRLLRPRVGTDASPSPDQTATAPQWEDWEFEGEDITHEILELIEDDLVQAVHDGDYPVGMTGIEELMFRNINDAKGTAEFQASFSAEHHREDFGFAGDVRGTISFDGLAETKEEFLDSIHVERAEAHFDMGDDGD